MIIKPPYRTLTVSQRIPGKAIGFRESIYVHVDFLGAEGGTKQIQSIRFSEKKKEDNTLDRLLNGLGDALTAVIRKEINGEGK